MSRRKKTWWKSINYKCVPWVKPKYTCFFLEPTNLYRKSFNGIIEELSAEEPPSDTLDSEYHRIYIRHDNQDKVILRDVPAGAMWFAPWLDHIYKPQLDHVLVIRLPDGTDFVPDAKAGNCHNILKYEWLNRDEADDTTLSPHELLQKNEGRKFQKEIPYFWTHVYRPIYMEHDHHCWIVHGEFPNITIDKDGRTCITGAGSIASAKWHGGLINGILS